MKEILDVLRTHESFLISSHINPDGDAVGSLLAFYSFLSGFEKKVSVINSDPEPFAYSFLPNVAALQYINFPSNVENTRHLDSESRLLDIESIPDADVAIILDCGSLDRIGEELVKRIRPGQILINIDHHKSNEYFGTHNLVNTKACATAEIVFNLIDYSDVEINREQALCIYTAILTDTGCFRYSNTTPETHKIAAQLIDKGVQPAQVAESVYEIIPYQRAKLLGLALDNLKISSDGRIAWVAVTNEMYEKAGAGSADTEGIIEYIRTIRDTEAVILFRELEDGSIKVSMRSKRGLDVAQIASNFGGGGHKAAAGCTIDQPLKTVMDIIIKSITSG